MQITVCGVFTDWNGAWHLSKHLGGSIANIFGKGLWRK